MADVSYARCSKCEKKFKRAVVNEGEEILCPQCKKLAAAAYDVDDEDSNPYGMKQVEVVPRCPSCAHELKSAKDVICINCGYNLLTREVGETKKLYDLSPQEHFLHLVPAIGALLFAFVMVLDILVYSLVLPRLLSDDVAWWIDSEPMRLFHTVIALLFMYWAGNYGLQHLFFKPKPPEREKD